MNFLKRAFTSIKRRLGKSILLLALVIILGSVISGAISVNYAINNTEMNLRRRMPTVVTLEYIPFSIQNAWDFESRADFLRNTIHEVGNLPYVDFFEYSQAHFIHSLYLRRYECEIAQENMAMQGAETPAPGEGFDFHSLRGFSRPEIVYIEAGEFELVAGRIFTEAEINTSNDNRSSVAIISRQMAEHNNIWTGDTITLSSLITSYPYPMEEWVTIDYEFEIIGIRDFVNRPYLEDFSTVQDGIMNRIFVPNWIVNLVEIEFDYHFEWDWEQPLFTVQPHFVLADPTYITDFMEAAYEILPEGVWLNDYSNRFGAIVHSTDMIVDITNMMMWGAIGAAIIVLTLVTTLFLHDRRHEIGIYLSLGEKKSGIVLQFLTEIMIVSVIGISVALFIGSIVSTQISQSMLRDELVAFEDARDEWDWTAMPGTIELSFGNHQLTHNDMLEAFDTSLGVETTLIFLGVGLSVVAISTMLPILYVVKLNPKKVLL